MKPARYRNSDYVKSMGYRGAAADELQRKRGLIDFFRSVLRPMAIHHPFSGSANSDRATTVESQSTSKNGDAAGQQAAPSDNLQTNSAALSAPAESQVAGFKDAPRRRAAGGAVTSTERAGERSAVAYTDEYYGKFLDVAYRGILGRQIDHLGRSAYLKLLASKNDFLAVLTHLLDSEEFKRKSYDFNRDPIILRYWTPAVQKLTHRLTTERSISYDAFIQQVDRAVQMNRQSARPLGGQEKYVEHHKVRFWEIANISTILINELALERKPLILDFGYSVNTLVLELLYPEAVVYSADRPAISLPEKRGARGLSADLAGDNLEERDFGIKFDLIIFSEVIEHILANPIKILRFLIKHLAPHGYLLVTTPNFFSLHKLHSVGRRINPQSVYPETYGPEDAPHFHIREYSMGELLEISGKAGGVPVAFFFSGCWDAAELLSRIPTNEWSNLCVVVQAHG